MKLSELCHNLNLGGPALEETEAGLDTLQVCQQSNLDLHLRLQILKGDPKNFCDLMVK